MRFAFLLAKDLGFVHPDEMANELTARQLGDWWAYYQIEPWGEERSDARMSAQLQENAYVSLPNFIMDVYAQPELSDEMKEQLRAIRNGNRCHDQH